MVKYCFDTSGLSNPKENMPLDIHESMWRRINQFIFDGNIGITTEIFDEMILIDGVLGEFIGNNKDKVLFEIGDNHWDWNKYLENSTRMQTIYEPFISEFNGGVKYTLGLNDLSIIALSKTLNLPLLSMETRCNLASPKKRKIPNICDSENIRHLTFTEFLRLEGFRF